MAELIISAVVGDMVGRVISLLAGRFKGQGCTDAKLRRICHMLVKVHSAVEEAKGRQITNCGTLEWLSELNDGVYQGRYLLDTVQCRDQELEDEHADKVVGQPFSLSLLNPAKRVRVAACAVKSLLSRHDVGVGEDMDRVVEILETVSSDLKEFMMLLRNCQPIHRPLATNIFVEGQMFGRHVEKQRIINFLLHDGGPSTGEKVGVLPIVGDIGVGKTTLAQHVCDDERVRSHFPIILYSNLLYTRAMARGEAALVLGSRHTVRDAKEFIESLHVLKQKYFTKRFLMVFEDVDADKKQLLEEILLILRHGKHGSRIIITTNSRAIAASMGTVQPISLKVMPHQEYWFFFKAHAFAGRDVEEDPRMLAEGKAIARKLNGSFFGAKIIGGVLKAHPNPQFWRRVVRSNIGGLSLLGDGIEYIADLTENLLPIGADMCKVTISKSPYPSQTELARLVYQASPSAGVVASRGDNGFARVLLCSLLVLLPWYIHKASLDNCNLALDVWNEKYSTQTVFTDGFSISDTSEDKMPHHLSLNCTLRVKHKGWGTRKLANITKLLEEFIMAEVIFSAVVGDMVGRMISLLAGQFKGQQCTEAKLRKICHMLVKVYSAVEEAKGRQITNYGTLEWLSELNDTVYQGRYLLDTVGCREQELEDEHADKVVAQPFSFSLFNPAKRVRVAACAMKRLLSGHDVGVPEAIDRVVEILETVSGDLKEFLMLLQNCQPIQRPLATNIFVEGQMFGRHVEKERIINFLLHDGGPSTGGKLGVLPIVGGMGVGKTTLAQHVCDDERVRNHFPIIVYSNFSYTRAMAQDEAPFVLGSKHAVRDARKFIESLHVLKEKCLTKRFLMVFEDVDTGKKQMLEELLPILRHGKHGSSIIITTNSRAVAASMGTVQPISLKVMPHQEYWFFFKAHAFAGRDVEEDPRMLAAGKVIARKLNGSFFGAKIIGGVLKAHPNPRFWSKVLRSNIGGLFLLGDGIGYIMDLAENLLPIYAGVCKVTICRNPFIFQTELARLEDLYQASPLGDNRFAKALLCRSMLPFELLNYAADCNVRGPDYSAEL
ncbi:uncharacterized protein [Triticum aestivum]|uniref:uncharacterized protein n=1 Tax=Triticum aestivum TaxID=4565 RepID=UPI001D014111|nr:uncharacterized protein LOC123165655 [Triticum aestivum]